MEGSSIFPQDLSPGSIHRTIGTPLEAQNASVGSRCLQTLPTDAAYSRALQPSPTAEPYSRIVLGIDTSVILARANTAYPYAKFPAPTVLASNSSDRSLRKLPTAAAYRRCLQTLPTAAAYRRCLQPG